MNTKNGDGQGIVFQKDRGQYSVHSNGRKLACSLSSRLHKELAYLASDPGPVLCAARSGREIDEADLIAIGDVVRFADAGENRGVITEILPRRNKLSRLST